MLQQLIHSARVNVFESARFYYGVLIVLTLHLFLRHFIIKILIVNGQPEWLFSKVVTAILYATIYGCCIFSAIIMRKQISKHFLYTWFILCCISVFNEFVFYLGNTSNYDLISSVSSGQGFMNIRITLPILFLGVWQATIDYVRFSNLFLNLIYVMTILNSAIVCVSIFFDISFFQSYPVSGRWGYSGLLSRGYSVILNSILLIDLLKRGRLINYKTLIVIIPLICSGTKAGLLSLGLILIVFLNPRWLRSVIIACCIFLIIKLPKWIDIIVNYSSFWKNVYDSHGPWGVLSSLRNKNLLNLSKNFLNDFNAADFLIGGKVRYETLWVEILPVDLFLFYGVIGFLIFIRFFSRLIPSWGHSVPLLTACLSGSLLSAPLAFIVWGLWCVKYYRVD